MTKAQKPTILIADKESAVVHQISAFLQEEGLTVFTATDYNTAWQTAQRETLHFALLSLQLTPRNEMPLAERITEHNPDCLIILMTSRPSLNGCIQALRNRYLDYLMKPFHLEELKQALDRGRARRRERGKTQSLEKRTFHLMQENEELKKRITALEKRTEPVLEASFSDTSADLVKKSYSMHTPAQEETPSGQE